MECYRACEHWRIWRVSASASEVQRERLHNEKETEIMCCTTRGEILTRAASQENVLGDMISFCAGSVRIGAGDGKASSRRLSFVHGDALCAHSPLLLQRLPPRLQTPKDQWQTVCVTPQHSDLQRFSTVIFTLSFTELTGWLAGWLELELWMERQPAIVRDEYCTSQ